MKYEGVTSESESDDEKLNEDKSRQGFSPAPPSFKRPNVLAVTPGHTPASITMPSPRGIMQVRQEITSNVNQKYISRIIQQSL